MGICLFCWFLFDESCFSAPASAYFKPMDTFTWDYNSGACCLDPPESRSRFGKNRKCMGNTPETCHRSCQRQTGRVPAGKTDL